MRLDIDTSHEHPVHVIVMDDHDNRLRPDMLAELRGHLDTVEAFDEPTALVLTGEGKFFSNGVDLELLMSKDSAFANEYLRDLFATMARFASFPGRAVAAINGHAFAGGGMLALCLDERVMRADRGWWCIPEADMGVPLHPAMTAVLRTRLPVATANEAILTGRRYTGPEALEAGVVGRLAEETDVLPTAVSIAAEGAGKDRPTQGLLKEGLYPELLSLLREPPDVL